MPGCGGCHTAPAPARGTAHLPGRRAAPSKSQRRLSGSGDGRCVGYSTWRRRDVRRRNRGAAADGRRASAGGLKRYWDGPQDAVGCVVDRVEPDGRRTHDVEAVMVQIVFDRMHGGADSRALIDFSVSTNPFGPPPAALDAYHRAAEAIGSYPEPYAATLTAAIAASLGVAPANVLAGNGSTQLIYLIARVLR